MAIEDDVRRDEGEPIACNPNIDIRVKNGTAVLSGWACSDEQKLQAEKAVNFLSGIDRVFNMVKTKRH